MLSSTSITLAILGLATMARAVTWNLTQTYESKDFLDTAKFTYFETNATVHDPTNGLVNYLSESAATQANLSSVQDDIYIMKVDTVEVAPSGRNSVRLTSTAKFEDGIYVVNITHAPVGCGAWPAIWTVVGTDLDDYPDGGEIDILEGANDQYPYNLATLHTKSSCTIPSSIDSSSGVVTNTNCSAFTTGNVGCQIAMNGTSTSTFGTPLNKVGGGIFAMQRALGTAGDGISVWAWNQGDESIPSSLKSGSQSVDSSSWGTPAAHFPVANSQCASNFAAHNLVINIDVGGDLPIGTYDVSSNCKSTYGALSSQVGFNGSSFNESYWGIDSIRIYAAGGGDENASNSPIAAAEDSSAGLRLGGSLGLATGLVGMLLTYTLL